MAHLGIWEHWRVKKGMVRKRKLLKVMVVLQAAIYGVVHRVMVVYGDFPWQAVHPEQAQAVPSTSKLGR